jgi:alkaline phosphatase D
MARWIWKNPSGPSGSRYWTDGWDGRAPARNRLLGVVADRKVPGVVVLGGDVQANTVADLKPDFDDPKSPVVATEFCGTSITSLGTEQDRVDAARRFNPHVHLARADRRGYVRFALAGGHLQADLRVLDDALDPAGGASSQARFVVAAGRPGAEPA